MRETTTVFEQRWTFWLSTLSGAALIVSACLALWLQSGATQCEVEIFKNVDPAKQGEGAIVGDCYVAELDLTRCHPVLKGQRSLPGS